MNTQTIQDQTLFDLSSKVHDLASSLMNDFNARNVKLTNFPSSKRIFIFFFTRALKTYSAIRELSQKGFGQDTATLLRSLLENLISISYILCDPATADQKTVRFVEYKWVIFKRYLSDTPTQTIQPPDAFTSDLMQKKALILEKIEKFKKKYGITSDKALVTWSGRSIRDMAKIADPALMEEYDSTFRQASRFSHPSIIGDREYHYYKGHEMIFSAMPSAVGVFSNFITATGYFLNIMTIFNELFTLNRASEMNALADTLSALKQTASSFTHPVQDKSDTELQRPSKEEIIVKFQTSSFE